MGGIFSTMNQDLEIKKIELEIKKIEADAEVKKIAIEAEKEVRIKQLEMENRPNRGKRSESCRSTAY